jgi:hypothetical protein
MGECDYSFIMRGLETSLDNKDGPFQFRRFNVFQISQTIMVPGFSSQLYLV